MKEGDMIYVKFGKGNKSNPCQLTDMNLLDRALVYYERFIKNPMYATLEYVLCEMLKTGQYSIHGRFFTHSGTFNYGRAQLAFISRVWPETVNTGDVRGIFFSVPRPQDRTQFKDRISTPNAPSAHDPFASQDLYVKVPFCSDDESDEEPDARRHDPDELGDRHARAQQDRAESSAAAANRARVRHVPHGILSALADTSGATDHAHRDPRVQAFLSDPEIDPNMLQDESFLLRDPFDPAHQF